jgi:hypothetical protein
MEKVLARPESAACRLDRLLRMHGASGRGISEYWRRNTHHLESAELSAVLRALRKLAGHIGRNTGRIEWAGMSQDTEDAIVLDPGMVMGGYPVPFHKFDYLAGLVAHESFRKTEWSDLLWKKIDKECIRMSILEKIVFQKIVSMGEDIYLDLYSEKSILSLYTKVFRDVAITEYHRELKMCRAQDPAVDYLVLFWWKQAFGEDDASGLSGYEDALILTNRLTAGLRDITRVEKGAAKRCSLRSRLYLDTWQALERILSGWNIINQSLVYSRESGGNGTHCRHRSEQKKCHVLGKGLALDVEARLAAHSSDITPIIKSVAGNDNEDVIPISKWDYNNSCHPVIDKKLVSRLKGVFQQYADRREVLNRGLTSGRVDRKRLYRAPVTGRCFFDRQQIPIVNWDICLLIDASGSMAGPRWRMVENIIGILHAAFRGFQNRLQAYAYFEVEGMCMISSLIKGRQLLSVPPAGQTASGQAIIAAAYFMPRNAKKKFLVHITDGESNIGCDVRYGIEYCRTQNINLVNLGVAYKDREALKKQYAGAAIQFLDHVTQLPNAMEKILKWILLYNKQHMLSFSITDNPTQGRP